MKLKISLKKISKTDIILNPPLNLKEIELQSEIKITNDFDENLNDVSSLFVDFRYIFEFENKEKSFMYIDNLRRVITARVSELNIDKK